VNDQPKKAGLYASAAMHAGLLAFLVFGFAFGPKFDDAGESIPVETVSQSQFNQIMKGERDAKPMKEAPPEPLQRQAAADPQPAPTPPPPPPDLKTAETPPPPAPPPKPTAEETPAPAPPIRPKETPPPKPKVDPLVKILEKDKEELAKPAKPTFDRSAIAKLIGETKTNADPTPTGATPQGLPDQHADRMSPSLAAALDAWLTDAYLSCWTPPPTMPQGDRYIAEVRVDFNPDGTLAATPELLNPPTDPAWRPHAESAVRAVLKCNPLRVPPQYAPYFEQWRTKTVHFDPQSALG
jgi:outer membrane biosynthesis protein TonB